MHARVRDGGQLSGDELSRDRIHGLYEISKLLTQFDGIDSTVPVVMERLSEAVALRSAVLILGGPRPRSVVWPHTAAAEDLRAAEAHARSAYEYLSGERTEVSRTPLADGHVSFIVLPLVVGHEGIFGVLQLEPLDRPLESDLLFANSAANQLAVALDRRAVIDAKQAAAAAAKERIEKERDAAETLLMRHEALLDNLDSAFAWEIDAATLRVLYVSARAEPLLGYPRARWLGTPNFWSECLHPQDRDLLVRAFQAAVATETNQRCEHRCVAADGRELWFQTGVHFTRNHGGPKRLQVVTVDVTATKRLEKSLREADRRKNEFLAMLAHELRSPLAPIANASALLHADTADDALRERALAIIERQTGRMTRLVDDLLDVARITSGKVQLKLEPTALASIVEHAAETVGEFVTEREHRLNLKLPAQPLWVDADAARLEQAVQNLLHNAAKYTPDGGRIDLTVERDGSDAVLRVRDTGVGIGPELLPHVFELFTQGESAIDRSRGGLGIGLALVKQLVVLHGGSIEVASTVGQGSEFVVRLPAAPPSKPPRTDTALRSKAQPLHVLVVDDNADTAASLAMLLETSGHTVSVADGGLAALAAAEAGHPQVAFLDIGLPELDGYEVARRMRRTPGVSDAVLVALTGYGRVEDRDRAHAAGFDHFLVKPADLTRIREILRDAALKPH